MYKYLLFDLDGTITDSFEGVSKSFAYALESYGIKVDDLQTLRPILGPPLRESFVSLFGFSEEEALKAVEKYRERYVNHYLDENRIYDGIPELLKKLCDSGFRLILATSKPEKFSKAILDRFDLTKYFYYVTGASMDKSRDTKEKVLAHILDYLKISDVSEAVMIGDRKYDLDGASYFGMDAVGVLYGYGTKEELEAHPHIYIAKDTEDLYNYLTK